MFQTTDDTSKSELFDIDACIRTMGSCEDVLEVDKVILDTSIDDTLRVKKINDHVNRMLNGKNKEN